MKKLYDTLLPKHVRAPLLVTLLFNSFVFHGVALLLGDHVQRIDPSLPLDDKVPFVPFFLLFYVLAYVQWFGSYIGHSRLGVEPCYRMVAADLIAKFLCMLCFLFLPTEMTRPEITGTGFWEQGVAFIYAIDRPISLLPSIHCLESWICFRTAMQLPKKNGWYITAQGVLTVLVLLSTVLIKQHTLLDIPTGVLAAEIGLQLANRGGLWRHVDKLQTPSARRALAAQRADHPQDEGDASHPHLL